MKDAELAALAEAQWIRSYVRLLMGSRMILGAPVLQPVRPTLHPSSLAPHDMIIATLQDRSAWHGLVAPCFPH